MNFLFGRLIDVLFALVIIACVALVWYGVKHQCKGTAVNAPVFRC